MATPRGDVGCWWAGCTAQLHHPVARSSARVPVLPGEREARWGLAVAQLGIVARKQVAVPSSVKLTEAGVPVVVLPYLNAAQGEYPALGEGIERLRGLGVRVLFGPDVLPLHGLARASATSSPGI
jgi:hypothetical protein